MTASFLAPVGALAASLIVAPAALGQARFSTPIPYEVGWQPSGMVSADFDGDGDLDVAAISSRPPVLTILLNERRGWLRVHDKIELPEEAALGQLAAGDLGGRALPDLVVTLPRSGQLLTLRNLGRGRFARDAMYDIGRGAHGLALGDLDADGDLDIVVANSDSHSISLLFNRQERATFESIAIPAGGDPRHIALGDLNGDGYLELIVTNREQATISIFVNGGGVRFGLWQTLSTGRMQPDALVLHDLDGNGFLDIVAAASHGDRSGALVYWNNGRRMNTKFYASHGRGAAGVSVSDLNLDGHPDIVLAEKDSGTLVILLGDRGQSFERIVQMRAGPGPEDVLTIDLDGDGDEEIVVTNSEGSTISVLMNGHARTRD